MLAMVSPCCVLADLALGCCGTKGLDVTCPLDALCISGEGSVLRAVEAGQELWLVLTNEAKPLWAVAVLLSFLPLWVQVHFSSPDLTDVSIRRVLKMYGVFNFPL